MQIHGNNLTTLHEQVPKSCLPTEFGGEAGSIAENWGMIHKTKLYVLKHLENA